ncbi:hypothetical protein [Aliarcobacter vitoriensis]|uniref:hypothetical protein n=1 Tax=Aliarcobacter vitoriensis TaxID=2011099 RepID=UPI001C9CC9A2|nr:hypothetical protein [Aliarcobacter vitoriensis]
MENVYKSIVLTIKELETEYFKYKDNKKYFLEIKVLKDILADLHEIRRKLKELEDN